MYTVFQVCSAESSEVGLLFLKYVHKRFYYCVWSNNHPWSAFILLGALLFNISEGHKHSMLNFTKFYKNSHENVCPLMICWRFVEHQLYFKVPTFW